MSAHVNELIERSHRLLGTSGTPAGGDENSYVHMFDGGQCLPDFPVDVFPLPIQRYIEDGATTINVPPDMIAVPLLGFAAGVIGNTRVIRVKPNWTERANLWLAVIGDPGSGKSPANDYARAPLDQLQSDAWESYEDKLVEWKQATAGAKPPKGSPGEIPACPVLDHYFTTDATTEALAKILATSPGVVMVRDELVGWVTSHDAYKKGGDRQNYLSLWAGSPLKVDRAGAETKHIRYPCVPIVGGIQPDMLPALADEAQRRDGFVERMLMTWPTPRRIVWNDASIDSSAKQGTVFIFRQLRPRDRNQSLPVEFTRDARKTFGSWYEDNGRIIEESSGIASGFYSKYPGQLARIILVLHSLHYPDAPQRLVDTGIVADAISLIEYFRAHLVRVLPRFSAVGTTSSAGLAIRILRILEKADGDWVARRELNRGLGNSVNALAIDEALAALEREGLVENRTVPTGARPRQESRISQRTMNI